VDAWSLSPKLHEESWETKTLSFVMNLMRTYSRDYKHGIHELRKYPTIELKIVVTSAEQVPDVVNMWGACRAHWFSDIDLVVQPEYSGGSKLFADVFRAVESIEGVDLRRARVLPQVHKLIGMI
jgi:hypothetical protein